MKTKLFEQDAIGIGNDSWELQHFTQLPDTATKEEMVAALDKDRDWQQSHIDYVARSIDELIIKIVKTDEE